MVRSEIDIMRIEETAVIRAPVARCFDLSRSVEVHLLANVHSGEQTVAAGGVTSGLVGLGEEVTWRAKHFGILPGDQFVSWIHETDFARAVAFLIEREEMMGAVNLAAPNPVPNREFLRLLREAWGTRFGLPTMRWMLEVGTWLLRTESELVLKSRRVVPGKLLEAGFRFEYPEWRGAAKELVGRWRLNRGG